MTTATSNNPADDSEPTGYEHEPEECYSPLPAELYPSLYHVETAALGDAAYYHEQLSLPAGSRVLELGCGTGRIAEQLHQRGFLLTGIDISLPMLAFNRSSRQVPTVRMDMCRLGFSRCFDAVIVAHNTLNLLADRTAIQHCLQELAVVLRPPGRIILHLFVPDNQLLTQRGRRFFQYALFDLEPAGTLLKESVRCLDSHQDLLHLNERFKLRFLPDGQPNRNYRQSCRLAAFSAATWQELIDEAGFTIVAQHGSFDAAPWCDGNGSTLLITAQLTIP